MARAESVAFSESDALDPEDDDGLMTCLVVTMIRVLLEVKMMRPLNEMLMSTSWKRIRGARRDEV